MSLMEELDLTPPDVSDKRFPLWLVENFLRIQLYMFNGFAGVVRIGEDSYTIEHGTVRDISPTAVFSDEFSDEFQ